MGFKLDSELGWYVVGMPIRPSRTWSRSASAIALSLLASACASAPPAESAGSPAPADANATAATSATASAATAPPATPSTRDAAAPTTAAAKRGPFPDDPPRREASAAAAGDDKQLAKKCKPMVDAMNSRAQKEKGKAKPVDIVTGLRKSPPAGMAPAQVTECADMLERSVREYTAASIEVEAKMMLARMAKLMVNAYEREKKLCPSSDKPVPARFADVEAGDYEAKLADWSAPTWKCLGVEMEGRQRYQYAVVSDDAAGTFEIIARGAPYGDGKAVDLVQAGRIIAGKGVEVPPPVRR